MAYKCIGGMFDCDGDRGKFAHKQWMDWLVRVSDPEGTWLLQSVTLHLFNMCPWDTLALQNTNPACIGSYD
eukprot:gene6817-7033_t